MILTIASGKGGTGKIRVAPDEGTPLSSMVGLGVAIEYMQGLGLDSIAAHEHRLRDYASARLGGLNWRGKCGVARSTLRAMGGRWGGSA